MYWTNKGNDAMELLNNPDNEFEVLDLFNLLDSDFIVDEGDGKTPIGRVYDKLKELGEGEIADNFIYPALKHEAEETIE